MKEFVGRITSGMTCAPFDLPPLKWNSIYFAISEALLRIPPAALTTSTVLENKLLWIANLYLLIF